MGWQAKEVRVAGCGHSTRGRIVRGLCPACYQWATKHGYLYDHLRVKYSLEEKIEEAEAGLLTYDNCQELFNITPRSLRMAFYRAQRTDLVHKLGRLPDAPTDPER